MPSASGAPWKPAAPTATLEVLVPDDAGDPRLVLGVRRAAASARRANVDRNDSVTKHRRERHGGERLAPARSPAARAACVGWVTWTMRTCGLMPAILAGSRRRPCRAPSASFLRALVDSRSPKTVPRVWSVSCWRQRASSPSPLERHRLAVEAGAVAPCAKSGRAHGDEGAGERQAALVVRRRAGGRLPSGSVEHRVADDARRCARRRRRGSRRRTPPGRRRSGRRPGRRRRRRTSSRPCRRPARAARRRTP